MASEREIKAVDPPYGEATNIIVKRSEHITGGDFVTPQGTYYSFLGLSGEQTLSINGNVRNYNVEVYCDSGYEVEAKLIGNSENSIEKTGENTFTYNIPNGNFNSNETIEFTAVPLGGGGSSMKQVTINLSFNTSNGSYSLSSSDTNLAQISADKQSYIIKGKTYTPTVDKTSIVNRKYRLNSYTMPAGSTVGTSRPSSTTSKTVNTTSDYTSDAVNYYTSHTTSPTYDYETARIDVNSSSGAVSGDTDACSYTLQYDTTITITGWNPIGTYEWDADVDVLPNKRLSTVTSNIATLNGLAGTELFTPRWTTAAIVGPDGSTYLVTSATAKIYYWADGYSRYKPRSTSATVSSGKNHISMTYRREDAITSETPTNYTFDSVTWDSTWNGYTRVGTASSSTTGGSGYTYATKQYRKQTSPGSTTYNPDIYAKFTFDASTGDISWSFRGTGSTNTTYTNKIKNNSTFDIDDLSTTTYRHDSTDWNADDLTIVSQSKTSITIGVPTIA